MIKTLSASLCELYIGFKQEPEMSVSLLFFFFFLCVIWTVQRRGEESASDFIETPNTYLGILTIHTLRDLRNVAKSRKVST